MMLVARALWPRTNINDWARRQSGLFPDDGAGIARSENW